jgi:hypothetical protein
MNMPLFLIGLILLGYGFGTLYKGEMRIRRRTLNLHLSGPVARVVGALQCLIGCGTLVLAMNSLLGLGINEFMVPWAFIGVLCLSGWVNLIGLIVAAVLKRLSDQSS